MSFFKKTFGKKKSDNKISERLPSESERCLLCSESSTRACKFPYSEDEITRHLCIGVFFHAGLDHDAAVQTLVRRDNWNPKSAHNCVNHVYPMMEKITGHKP